ncbi:MAG: ornithine cyclodeaminase [Polaromonas sp.]|nr:ornithine cyclodeaminase [Polaromonas sp.]
MVHGAHPAPGRQPGVADVLHAAGVVQISKRQGRGPGPMTAAPPPRFISDDLVRATLGLSDAYSAMELAFRSHGLKQAVNLLRTRTSIAGATLSTMGAVLLDGTMPMMGVKSYPTLGGQFNFVISLFCARTGAALAMVQGNALTELRTAAVTLLAARHMAPRRPQRLAVFGSGAQARAHTRALLYWYRFEEVLVVDPHGDASGLAATVTQEHGIAAQVAAASEAVCRADFIVTATRSKTPLFDGALVRPGSFVAAIGSSKPDCRELDDCLLARAACIGVEDPAQACAEAGELVMADARIRQGLPILALGDMVVGTTTWKRAEQDITIYKSVGIGLEDIALARMLYERLTPAMPVAD